MHGHKAENMGDMVLNDNNFIMLKNMIHTYCRYNFLTAYTAAKYCNIRKMTIIIM